MAVAFTYKQFHASAKDINLQIMMANYTFIKVIATSPRR